MPVLHACAALHAGVGCLCCFSGWSAAAFYSRTSYVSCDVVCEVPGPAIASTLCTRLGALFNPLAGGSTCCAHEDSPASGKYVWIWLVHLQP
jgi:hypothetical protein